MSIYNNKFWAADDASSSGSLNADSILDILNDEGVVNEEDEIDLSTKGAPKDKLDKKEPEEKDTSEEDSGDGDSTDDEESGVKKKKDDYDELEDELDEQELEEDETSLVNPVRRKEILAKYPNLFKDFPQIEKAYYREQKYAEIFPSVDDAKSAREDSVVLKAFERQILSGDISDVVSELKREDGHAFNKLVDNYLPTLQKVDQQAFFHVVSSVVKPIIFKMVEKGSAENNQDLVAAAKVLNEFFYGTSRWEPHKPLAKQESPDEHEGARRIAAERQEMFTERFSDAKEKLTERVDTSLRRAIVQHIDPKGDMTDYVRKTATRDAYETVSNVLAKDTRFRTILDRAWRQAGENNFNTESMEKIRRIISSRAKTVLPAVIKKARNEALRGIGKRVRTTDVDNDNDNDDNNSDKSGRSASSVNRGPLRQSSGRGGSTTTKSEIPKGMSNKDYIMSD